MVKDDLGDEWVDTRPLHRTWLIHSCHYVQVEQHIRRNALRLNLADRLNMANAPSSEISSEVISRCQCLRVANYWHVPV